MGKNLTTNQKTQLSGSSCKTRRLITIDLDTPFRILENDSSGSIEINGDTYYTKLVQTSAIQGSLDGSSEKIDVIISDISQDFAGLVAEYGDIMTNTSCEIKQVIFDGDTTTLVGDPVLLFEGLINNLQMSQYGCSFSVERALYSYSTVSPNMTYDVNCQYNFKDTRCQYAGSETKCNKTLSRCQALGNVTRFGGYPSVTIPVSLS